MKTRKEYQDRQNSPLIVPGITLAAYEARRALDKALNRELNRELKEDPYKQKKPVSSR